MSTPRSAFKTQKSNRYGSVEKMYIHFYTIPEYTDTTSSNSTSRLNIFWYNTPTENVELFDDIHTLLKKMKQYTKTQYTGDIISINNLQEFKEYLILMGVDNIENPTISQIMLKSGTSVEMNCYTVLNGKNFNDLFDVCFQNYDFHQSFSDSNDTIIESNTNEPLMYLENIFYLNSLKHFYTQHIDLNVLAFNKIKTSIDTQTLNSWFETLIRSCSYYEAAKTIDNLKDFTQHIDPAPSNEVIDDGTSVVESVATERINSKDWIKLFCNLYLEEKEGSDILLSDIYQEYVAASKWTETPTVSMAIFIKQLRGLNKYSIKRRAKGMMLLGHISLVSKQSDFKRFAQGGALPNRNLLKYLHPRDIKNIITTNEHIIKSIGHQYAREVIFLLSDSTLEFDYQTVAQFCAIPELASELDKVSKYIDSNLSQSDIFSTTYNNDTFYRFRQATDEIIVYYPFNKEYFIDSPISSTLLKSKSVPDNVLATKDNKELAYYEFGNTSDKMGVDLNWADSFSSSNALPDLSSFHVSDRLTHSVPSPANNQLRKEPEISCPPLTKTKMNEQIELVKKVEAEANRIAKLLGGTVKKVHNLY